MDGPLDQMNKKRNKKRKGKTDRLSKLFLNLLTKKGLALLAMSALLQN